MFQKSLTQRYGDSLAQTNYYEVVTHHIGLKDIKENLNRKRYHNLDEYITDVRTVFENGLKFFISGKDAYYDDAQYLLDQFSAKATELQPESKPETKAETKAAVKAKSSDSSGSKPAAATTVSNDTSAASASASVPGGAKSKPVPKLKLRLGKIQS
eukprot:Rmarinus@m.12497